MDELSVGICNGNWTNLNFCLKKNYLSRTISFNVTTDSSLKRTISRTTDQNLCEFTGSSVKNGKELSESNYLIYSDYVVTHDDYVDRS